MNTRNTCRIFIILFFFYLNFLLQNKPIFYGQAVFEKSIDNFYIRFLAEKETYDKKLTKPSESYKRVDKSTCSKFSNERKGIYNAEIKYLRSTSIKQIVQERPFDSNLYESEKDVRRRKWEKNKEMKKNEQEKKERRKERALKGT
ncbi:Plasmodium exported protein, unknown function [Plasmodium gallinaceum]|uniref:Uncharacterized protein n=1 Tax=Plasmodium gallinaceum TaxID=5849 RepID=A0A1J1GZB9_PLAGA|nr:Plasmodium exported protein, unknown function [Plasmodium gallinaceum]CRG97792.1 Plasmodium exported protein, unknown function [Plasmodium gallinaceum]